MDVSHGFFNQINHIISILAVNGIALYIIEVYLIDILHAWHNAPRSNKIFLQIIVEKRIPYPGIAAWIGESSFFLTINGFEQCIINTRFTHGSGNSIFTEVISRGNKTTAG